jgi:uncharacterized membrane protein YagU involved in acid resistance
MQVLNVPAADRSPVPMMMMVSAIVGSTSLATGWLYHLFNSVVIGALYGLIVGKRDRTYGQGFETGALYATAWWIFSTLLLMPLFLRIPLFSPVLQSPFRPVVIASFVGHLIYGLVLGGLDVGLTKRLVRREEVVEADRHEVHRAA